MQVKLQKWEFLKILSLLFPIYVLRFFKPLLPEAAVAVRHLVAGGEEKAAWPEDRSSRTVPGEIGTAQAAAAQVVARLDQSGQL